MFHLAFPAAEFRYTEKAPQCRPLFRLPPKRAKAQIKSLIKLTTHVYSYFFRRNVVSPFLLAQKFPLPCCKVICRKEKPQCTTRQSRKRRAGTLRKRRKADRGPGRHQNEQRLQYRYYTSIRQRNKWMMSH